MTLPDSPTAYEFDVAVSFAGEDRGLVEAVVTQLQRSGVRVFYDDDQAAATWGQDLIEYFDQIYRLKSRYAVLFISRHYASKMWTRHKRRSALARGLEQTEPYVLPIRLDDTALEGLRPTVGYLDARRVGLDGIVAAVLAKLSGAPSVVTSRQITGVPRDEVGRQLLLFEQPPGWEHLYLAAQLLHERDVVEPMYRDHKLRYAPRTGIVIVRDQVYDFMIAAMNDAQRLMSILTQLMSPQAQDSAVGIPGQTGDAELIAHLAARWNSIYVDLMQWAAQLRGANTPSECHAAMDALAAIVDAPIDDYRAFIEDFAEQLEGLPQRVTAGEIGIAIEVTLTVAISPQASARLNAEMRKLDPRWR